jgi:benzoyl-CoA reductase/2-hydroxyglutaryl-CoA dehydratase subunit BcrC/BadD/HgdB
MSTLRALQRLDEYLKVRVEELRELKRRGKKIIGYLPGGFMPEELVYACDAIPVQLIRGGDPEPVAISAGYVPRFLDTFCRSQIGYKILGGEPLYELIDLLVVPVTDNNIRAVADCWNYYTKVEVFRYGVPHVKDDLAFDYYLEGLRSLKEKLENFTGNKVEENKLKKAIELSNRMRALFRRISSLRQSPQPPITGKDFIKLNHASSYADNGVMLEILESVLSELEKKEVHLGSPPPRVLLTGSTLAMGDYKVVDLLEGNGAQVVIEYFDEGLRDYWQHIEMSGDLLKDLAESYFRKKVPAAYFRPSRERLDFILKLAKEFQVDGIVWYQLMYRDGVDIQSYRFSRMLNDELRIPMLKLQSDWDVAGEVGQFRTRIETFVQMISRRK